MHITKFFLTLFTILRVGYAEKILLIVFTISFQNSVAQYYVRSEKSAKIDFVTHNNGVAVADYNQDGYLDIFFTGYKQFNSSDGTTWNRLLKNNGDGTFEDVTVEAGFDNQFVNKGILASMGEKMGASWGDYDNDGFPDLFLTNSREDQLFHNQGDGTFIDVTEQAGVAGCNECYSGSGLWWDYNGDGYLDLYVGNLKGENRMYENQRDGTFIDVTEQTGLGGWGVTWTSVALDVGRDGFLDLYAVNDTQENQFWENRNGIYNEASKAYRLDDPGAGMGITIGDYNNDGLFDIYITNIYSHFPNPLFKNNGNLRFINTAKEMGVENTGWGWGTKFFDFDHDGDEDLYATNGVPDGQYIFDIKQQDENNFFFKNLLMEGTEIFLDWSKESGTDGAANGRGIEVFDYDGDGDLDIIVANVDESPYLYRNETIHDNQPDSKNWIKIWLEGTTSNRDAFGTEVKVTIKGESYHRYHHGAGFFSQSIQPVHFGLGAANIIDEIEIIWPTRKKQIIYDVEVNQTLHIQEIEQKTITHVKNEIEDHPVEVYNYPNPFSSSTKIHFKLAKPGFLDLKVFSIIGKELFHTTRMINQKTSLDISWNGSDKNGANMPSGVYIYLVDFNNSRFSGKIIKVNDPP